MKRGRHAMDISQEENPSPEKVFYTDPPNPDKDALPQASVEELRRGRRRFTRRAVLIGLAGMAGTGFVVKALLGNAPISFRTGLPYRGHTAVVYRIAWSPAGTRLASGGNDKTAQAREAS